MWRLWGESFCVQSLLPSMRPSPDLLLGNKTQGSSERTRIVQQPLRASSTTAKPASTGVCVCNRAWSQTFLKHQSDQSSPCCDSGTSPVHSTSAAAATAVITVAHTSSPYLFTCWRVVLLLNRDKTPPKHIFPLTKTVAEWLKWGCLLSFKETSINHTWGLDSIKLLTFIFQLKATLAHRT